MVGIIEGLADGTASLSKVVSGRLADRRGRKRLVGLGYGLAASGKVLIAAATVWPLVLAARVLDRVGKGVRGAPRDALIADGAPEADRGRAFGFHRALDTTGAVLGPLAGLGLYAAVDHRFRPLLVIAVIPAVASAALVGLVREPRRRLPLILAGVIAATLAVTVVARSTTAGRPGGEGEDHRGGGIGAQRHIAR